MKRNLIFLAALLLGFVACNEKEEAISSENNTTPYLMEVMPASDFTLLNRDGGVVIVEISEDCYVQNIYEKGEDIDFSGVRILGSDDEDYLIIYSFNSLFSSEKKGSIPWIYAHRDWYEIRQTGLRTFEITCFPCEDERSLKLSLFHLFKLGPHAIIRISLVAD